MDRSRYPANWEEISRQIRDGAGNCCEWCGVPNGAVGYRDPVTGYFYPAPGLAPGEEIGSFTNPPRWTRVSRVVLTVAHLGAFRGPVIPGQPIPWGDPHDKMDVRPENLAALCNRCHLGYDLMDHVKHAAETRRQKKIQAGQQVLMEAL